MPVNDADLLEMHRCMVRCRVVDERMAEARVKKGGAWHSTAFCEAAVVGSFWGLRPDDVLSPHYRHYVIGMLARGLPMKEALVQAMGRRAQVRRWADWGMMPRVAGSEGSYIPISAGLALAAKLRGRDSVVVAGCGDGSTGLGDFHEGLNLAAVLDLPMVLVAVNNRFYMHVPLERFLRTGDVAGMARSYGIPGVAVDGTDLLAVREAVEGAVARARAGKGPTLIECKTFRMSGHWIPDSMDPEKYYPGYNREVKDWKARDPIGFTERVLVERGVSTPKELAGVRAETVREFDDAYAAAEALPALDASDVAAMEKSLFLEGA